MRPLLCLAALLASTLAATAQRPGGQGAAPAAVAISPDGTTIAWTLRGDAGTVLHLAPRDNPSAGKTISPPGQCSIADPTWSPDGQTLAFLAGCTAPAADPTIPRQVQVYLWLKSSGDIRQLTHLTGELNQAAWSPDGHSIAFLFVENATRSAGALDAMKPWSGVIGEDNIEVQRVDAVDVATGQTTWLTPANLHVYEFDWAPNSQSIAFIAANPPGENNWWVAKLYKEVVKDSCFSLLGPSKCTDRLAETTVGIIQTVFDPNTTKSALHGLQIAVPRFSPDGKRIAFIGGLMSDQGSTGGDIWVVPANGGQPTDITPKIDGTPCFEGWLNDNTIGFVEDRRGHTLLADYDVDRRALTGTVLDLGEVSISGGPIKDGISALPDGTLAFVKSGATQPPEIFAGHWDALKQITHLNANAKPGPEFKSIEWTNEGFHVQGWLTYPINFDPAKKYPLIVEVHGGPSASAGPRPETMWSQQGYFVLAPNPRGSFGQGEAFVQANRKDFGYGDLRDILKGVDTVEAMVPIDKRREGLTGWSYGGFMSMFASTQTGRFRAIVAGAGISDWQSYYGENSIDQWMIPFFGASVYNDPAVYAKSSAITFIHKAAEYKTPMLIIVGDRDGECPAPQSFEMWHALRAFNVPTQLVVYPDEGHGFRNPAHIADRNQREIAWFAKYMPAQSQQEAANRK